MTAGANGASVEIVVVNGEPRIELVRGSLYAKELLTRDEAAQTVERAYGNVSLARECSGDCWVCLLSEAVDELFA